MDPMLKYGSNYSAPKQHQLECLVPEPDFSLEDFFSVHLALTIASL